MLIEFYSSKTLRCIPTIPTHVELNYSFKKKKKMLVKTTCRPESIESAENRHNRFGSQMSATYYYLYCFDMHSFHWMRKLYLFFSSRLFSRQQVIFVPQKKMSNENGEM